jgi:threonine synthase
MDVGNPSNFERMSWLYARDVDAMRRDIRGCRYVDDETRATIADVYARRGYVLDPHSAIAYKGLRDTFTNVGRPKCAGVFLATAHPAKFGEVVEPVIGRAPDLPPPLADALARPRQVLRLEASLDAVRSTLDG